MKKPIFTSLLASLVAFPAVAKAVTYAPDGAVLLGSEGETASNNLVAAIGGANLSLTCLGIVVLMLATIYIFHRWWHPKRQHGKMTEEEITQGSIRFYIGGSLLWMLVAIMAETWCVILPLALILIVALIYYIITLSSATFE